MTFNKVQNIKGTHRNISDESDDDLGKLLREQREAARQRDLGRSNVEYPKGSPAGKSGCGKPREVASCSEASYLAREEGELVATTPKGGILPNPAETEQGAGVKIAATQDSASKLGNHPKNVGRRPMSAGSEYYLVAQQREQTSKSINNAVVTD